MEQDVMPSRLYRSVQVIENTKSGYTRRK